MGMGISTPHTTCWRRKASRKRPAGRAERRIKKYRIPRQALNCCCFLLFAFRFVERFLVWCLRFALAFVRISTSQQEMSSCQIISLCHLLTLLVNIAASCVGVSGSSFGALGSVPGKERGASRGTTTRSFLHRCLAVP